MKIFSFLGLGGCKVYKWLPLHDVLAHVLPILFYRVLRKRSEGGDERQEQ